MTRRKRLRFQNRVLLITFLTVAPFVYVLTRLPVLGQVAAGLPIGADIGSDAYVVLDRVLFSPSPDYLLKVKGDSVNLAAFESRLKRVWRTFVRSACIAPAMRGRARSSWRASTTKSR